MIPSECCDSCVHSLVKVEDQGKKFIIENKGKKAHVKIAYDGCVIKDALTADYVVRCPEGDIVVELKGVNVDHGLKQVLATASHFRGAIKEAGPFAAIVVASQFPRISTAVQRAKLDFLKKFGGPLHVVSKSGIFQASKVLSQRGPH